MERAFNGGHLRNGVYHLQLGRGHLSANRQFLMVRPTAISKSATTALWLLLVINLFNYIDRQVLAAVEPEIRATFFASNDLNAMAKIGLLGTAFLVSYMLSAPILGFLADRISRWVIVGAAVILWSLASGAAGVGVGRGAWRGGGEMWGG